MEFSNPDVSEAGRVPVILEPQGSFSVRDDLWLSDVFCCSLDLGIVVDENTIMKNRDATGGIQASVLVKFRGDKDCVVGLPFARGAARIDQRHRLLVD